jgi:hypothetical protein
MEQKKRLYERGKKSIWGKKNATFIFLENKKKRKKKVGKKNTPKGKNAP